MRSGGCVRSPAEWGVPGHQHGGNGIRIEMAEGAANGSPGLQFVVAGNLRGSQALGYGHCPVEGVRVRGSEAGDGRFSLSPRGGEFGMRVRHAANAREILVQLEMCCEVGGWTQCALDNRSFEIANNNFRRRELIVR